MTNETIPQSTVVADIARLVRVLHQVHDTSFRVSTDASGSAVAVTTQRTHHIWNLRQMYECVVALEGFELDGSLRVFFEGCQKAGVEFSPLVGMTCLDENECRYLGPEETIFLLIERIREQAR